MDEYISKAKFVEVMRKKARNNFDLYYADKSKHYHDKAIGYQTAADEAHDFPAEDVQPIRHGKWIAENRDNRGYADCFTCTNCDDYVYTYTLMKDCEFEYCPHCGAIMDLMDGDTNG